MFNLTAICRTETVAFLEDKLYFHRDRVDSAVKTLKIEEHFLTIKEGYLKDYDSFGKNKDIILQQMIRRLLSIRYNSKNDYDTLNECNMLLHECEAKLKDLNFKSHFMYFLMIKVPILYTLIRKLQTIKSKQ